MNNYEKPVVMVNEELAEGVYAASGAVSTCWKYNSSQTEGGGDGVYRNVKVHLYHDSSEGHGKEAISAVVYFNETLGGVKSDDVTITSWSGNQVSVSGILSKSDVVSNPNCNVVFTVSVKASASVQCTGATIYSE